MVHSNIAIVAYTQKNTNKIGSMRIVANDVNQITQTVMYLQNELLHQVAGMKLKLDSCTKEEIELKEWLKENIEYQESLNITHFALVQNGLEEIKEYKVTHLDIDSLKEIIEKQKELKNEQRDTENTQKSEPDESKDMGNGYVRIGDYESTAIDNEPRKRTTKSRKANKKESRDN